MGENKFCNLFSWQSNQLKRVARNSLTAETLALLDGVELALYMNELFKEFYKTGLPVEVHSDNQSLWDAQKLSKYVKEKRLRIDRLISHTTKSVTDLSSIENCSGVYVYINKIHIHYTCSIILIFHIFWRTYRMEFTNVDC